MLIPKSTRHEQRPESWWLDTWGDGEGLVVSVKCPAGHVNTLWSRRQGDRDSSHHTIADDGTVSPSVVCPREGCSFHEFIRLDGWKPVTPDQFELVGEAREIGDG